MSISVPSHLYRNRHGTFYFRYIVPKALQAAAGRSEVRFSLDSEQRQTAIIRALPLIADLPRLEVCLQTMADTAESAPRDFFKLWQLQVADNANLRAQIGALNRNVEIYKARLKDAVPLARATSVVRQAHVMGKLQGQSGVIARLEFPWAPGRTKLYSELLPAYLNSFTYRAKGATKKPIGAKTLEGYEKDIGFFISVMGDTHIGAIDRDVAGEYFNVLRQLPPNISRVAKYRGKSIPSRRE